MKLEPGITFAKLLRVYISVLDENLTTGGLFDLGNPGVAKHIEFLATAGLIRRASTFGDGGEIWETVTDDLTSEGRSLATRMMRYLFKHYTTLNATVRRRSIDPRYPDRFKRKVLSALIRSSNLTPSDQLRNLAGLDGDSVPVLIERPAGPGGGPR